MSVPGGSEPAYFLGKVALTLLVVIGAAELAKRSSWLGALVVALPLASILSMTWLYLDTRDSARVAEFARNILLMLPPSLLFFLPFLMEPKTHWPFWLNCGLGCAMTAAGVGITALLRGLP